MNSFHQMRGRTLLEALSASIVAISLAGAWIETGVRAFLPASGAMLVFAIVHLTRLSGAKRSERPVPQRQASDEAAITSAVERPPREASALAEAAPAETAAAEAVPADPEVETSPSKAPPPAKKPRAARKTRSRGSAKSARTDTSDTPTPVGDDPEPAAVEEAEAMLSLVPEPLEAPRIEPLFDPEPHFRQHRAVFGRKAG